MVQKRQLAIQRERDTDRQKDKERKIQTYTTFLRLKISENDIQIIFAS